MAWSSEGPGASKVTRLKKNKKPTKSVKDNMMKFSLSLKENMVSEVIILRNSF